MLKLFKFSQGWDIYYAAFTNEEEAYERRAEVHPTFHFTNVVIEEIQLDGYVIDVYPVLSEALAADLVEDGVALSYEEEPEPEPEEPKAKWRRKKEVASDAT